ncbi:MAG: hypothetical protein M3N91_11400 [Pseudomonadota bacterium]|nr:hypothetical protein [Pseudomonadota bacterium]
MKRQIGCEFTAWAFVLATSLAFSPRVTAAAIDDIRVEVSGESCEGFGPNDKSFVVYATNTNPSQSVRANFKYESVPAKQHFILFDATLSPITDRFPKYHARRLAPREVAPIGCTATYRAAPQPRGPLTVPLVIAQQNALYVDQNEPAAPAEDTRSFAAFYLQGGISECGPGAKPPGLFYFVNLHPFGRLSASIDLTDDRGNRVGAVSANLAPLSATKAGCSNGSPKPGAVANATLEGAGASLAANQTPAAPSHDAQAASSEQPRVAAPSDAAAVTLAPLSLGTILQTENVCAGSLPPGWIKINDAWNPTVCGNPTGIAYNIWTIQRLADQPKGTIIHACNAAVPSGWAIVGTAWNPTVCGHPAGKQSNVMAIKRLSD